MSPDGALKIVLDILAEAKSDCTSSFDRGVLAGVEDSIYNALSDLEALDDDDAALSGNTPMALGGL